MRLAGAGRGLIVLPVVLIPCQGVKRIMLTDRESRAEVGNIDGPGRERVSAHVFAGG